MQPCVGWKPAGSARWRCNEMYLFDPTNGLRWLIDEELTVTLRMASCEMSQKPRFFYDLDALHDLDAIYRESRTAAGLAAARPNFVSLPSCAGVGWHGGGDGAAKHCSKSYHSRNARNAPLSVRPSRWCFTNHTSIPHTDTESHCSPVRPHSVRHTRHGSYQSQKTL